MNPWSAEHRLGALRKGIETGRDGARRSDRGAVQGFKARNSFRRILILTLSLRLRCATARQAGEKEQPLDILRKLASREAADAQGFPIDSPPVRNSLAPNRRDSPKSTPEKPQTGDDFEPA